MFAHHVSGSRLHTFGIRQVVTVPVTVVTVPSRTATSKIAIYQPLCDGVTVVTVLTSANLKGGGAARLAKRKWRVRKVGKQPSQQSPYRHPTVTGQLSPKEIFEICQFVHPAHTCRVYFRVLRFFRVGGFRVG